MSHEQDWLDRRARQELRLAQFIAAVATGAIEKKNMPASCDRASAAAEIVAFAVEIEKASREHFS